jgi:hypothetical protein
MKVKILCSLCKNRVQSEVPYYADNVVLTVQCSAQSFSGYIREPNRNDKLKNPYFFFRKNFLGDFFCKLFQRLSNQDKILRV